MYFQNLKKHLAESGLCSPFIINKIWYYLISDKQDIYDLSVPFDIIKNNIISLNIPMYDLDFEVQLILETIMVFKVDYEVTDSIDSLIDDLADIYSHDGLTIDHIRPYLASPQFLYTVTSIDFMYKTLGFIPNRWITNKILGVNEVISDG